MPTQDAIDAANAQEGESLRNENNRLRGEITKKDAIILDLEGKLETVTSAKGDFLDRLREAGL